jgi:hypothetical protein
VEGRVYTVEDELDLLHEDLGKARRRLHSIERAPLEGRWTGGQTEWLDAVANQRARIRFLERELAHLTVVVGAA